MSKRKIPILPIHGLMLSLILNVATAQYIAQPQSENELLEELNKVEQQFGSQHPDLVRKLRSLGYFYYLEHRYEEAEALYEKALSIVEDASGPEDMSVSYILHDLKYVYDFQGKYPEAEAAAKRALAIYEVREATMGIPGVFRFLALNYLSRGMYAEAEVYADGYLSQAVSEEFQRRQPFESDALSILSDIYRDTGRYAEAVSFCRRAKALEEARIGSDATFVFGAPLARIYHAWGKYADAERLYGQTLEDLGKRSNLKCVDPGMAYCLYGLAELYLARSRYTDAEPLYEEGIRRMEASREKMVPSDPSIGEIYSGLARTEIALGQNKRADVLFKQALANLEKSAPVHRLPVLQDYASLLKEMGRDAEAEEIEQQVRALQTASSP